MRTLPLEPLQLRLKLTLDWARAIEKAYVDVSRGMLLNLERSEVFTGINQQVKLLAHLLNQFRGRDMKISEEMLFQSLCDAYSFYPRNEQITGLLRYIWMLHNKDAYIQLYNDANRSNLFVHISCQKRIPKAAASVESFGSPLSDEAHIIVVGSATYQQPGLSFDYSNGVLTIPVTDWYEGLYQKTFYTFTLLSSLLNYERLFKLDDDVLMLNRNTLSKAIEKLKATSCGYAGSTTMNSSGHSLFNGWHINKCHNKAFEKRGISHFATTSYAMGGLGYQLSHRSTRLIRTRFLANPLLYGKPQHVLPEDELLGLMLGSENILCKEMPTAQLGLRVESGVPKENKTTDEFTIIRERFEKLIAQPCD